MRRIRIMRRNWRRAGILFVAIGFAALASMAPAQVLAPPEIQDLQMRELQQKHMTDLKAAAASISSHPFPYKIYFSRKLDVSEHDQRRMDQRSIRFEKFHNQTVLEITANYYASYSAELMQQEERAQRTLFDVMLPMLQTAAPALVGEEKLQAFALEISHHVRKKMLGVSTENAENVAFFLPRAAAQRLVSAKTRAEQEATLMQGSLFVDGKPVAGWGRGDADRMAESQAQPRVPSRSEAKSVSGATVWPPAAERTIGSIPVGAAAGAIENSTPPARLAVEPRDTSPDALHKLQSSNQEVLDRLVREVDKDAHFVSYAPPTFMAFHKGTFLELSLTTTLRENEPGSQYRAAALAFDEHIAHLVRPVVTHFQEHADFDGIDFSTSVRAAGVSSGGAVAVEFIFPLAALRAYEQYDLTGQQLIDRGFVLINGERVSLHLESAEAGVAAPR
jgi:hypothetical protein